MIYEYAAISRRRFLFVHPYVAIANYESISPIYRTCRAICAEAVPLMKSVAEARPEAMRVPRIIVNGLKSDGLDSNSMVVRKICRVCEEARVRKPSVDMVDINMRESDYANHNVTYGPYHNFSEEACRVIAVFANSAAIYLPRYDHLNPATRRFPRLPDKHVRMSVALIDAPTEKTFPFGHIRDEMQQHVGPVGPCTDDTDDLYEEWEDNGHQGHNNYCTILYDVGREPREWEDTTYDTYYGGVIDEETWKRDWT